MIVRETIERFASGDKYRLLTENDGPRALAVVYANNNTTGVIRWRGVGGADNNPFCDRVLAQLD
jgi:hypothetical protein